MSGMSSYCEVKCKGFKFVHPIRTEYFIFILVLRFFSFRELLDNKNNRNPTNHVKFCNITMLMRKTLPYLHNIHKIYNNKV